MADDELIAGLPDDPLLALKSIADKSDQLADEFTSGEEEVYETKFIRLLALSIAIIKKHSLKTGFGPPDLGPNKPTNITAIVGYFEQVESATNTLSARDLYQTSLALYERVLDVGFHYEFSDGEIQRLQILINEMRDVISEAGYFDAEHKQRLLDRLERLQAELHKRVSDLDRFIGTMAVVGAAVGQFGEDAKPIVDRLREFGEIVSGVFRRAENLVPGPEIPLLPKPDDTEDDAP